jgi:hypothetical protein
MAAVIPSSDGPGYPSWLTLMSATVQVPAGSDDKPVKRQELFPILHHACPPTYASRMCMRQRFVQREVKVWVVVRPCRGFCAVPVEEVGRGRVALPF